MYITKIPHNIYIYVCLGSKIPHEKKKRIQFNHFSYERKLNSNKINPNGKGIRPNEPTPIMMHIKETSERKSEIPDWHII